jgi:hypothetical protein
VSEAHNMTGRFQQDPLDDQEFRAMSTALLWLFILNLGIAFGAGVYEHRIVISRWMMRGTSWDAEAAVQDDTGRRFWVFVTTGPLTLLTVTILIAAWSAPDTARAWWLAAAVAALADRTLTFGYFIPTMIRLMRMPDSAQARQAALGWLRANHIRHALTLTAWMLALQAFALLNRRA